MSTPILATNILTTTMEANWNYPTSIHFGAGRIKDLTLFCQELGMRKPCLVTDPGLAASPISETIKTLFLDAGVQLFIFSNIKTNPTGENIAAGVTSYADNNCDGVIALGGGSALDAGKAIGLMVGQNRPLWDFEDINDNWTRVNEDAMAPVIAVPTTAGTGSEVGRVSVITDTSEKRKKFIFHPKIMPEIVIADPELTIGLPPHLTAATGMDALSHNLEAFCSPYFHPLSNGIALEGINLISEALPLAYKDGGNIEARSKMLCASTMGATAFQKGLGAMHALAHPLGALYDTHHGLLNAVLMPYVLKANQAAIERKISGLCAYLNINQGFSGFLNWVLDLRATLGIPHTLADIQLDDTEASLIGQMAFEDASAATNPISFSAEDYQNIFVAALKGAL